MEKMPSAPESGAENLEARKKSWKGLRNFVVAGSLLASGFFAGEKAADTRETMELEELNHGQEFSIKVKSNRVTACRITSGCIAAQTARG